MQRKMQQVSEEEKERGWGWGARDRGGVFWAALGGARGPGMRTEQPKGDKRVRAGLCHAATVQRGEREKVSE